MRSLPTAVKLVMLEGAELTYDDVRTTRTVVSPCWVTYFIVTRDERKPCIVTTTTAASQVLGQWFDVSEMRKETSLYVRAESLHSRIACRTVLVVGHGMHYKAKGEEINVFSDVCIHFY